MTPRRNGNRLVALALLLLATCGVPRRRTPDDTLVVLVDTPFVSVDPRYTSTNNDTKVSRIVASGLVAIDTDDSSPRLELAEDIRRIGPLVWQVTLRSDARFSDGTPVTAADVAWTYGQMMSRSNYAKDFTERFVKVQAVGDRVVWFFLVGPLATFMTDIDVGIVAEHGGDAILGAGPYRLASFHSDRVVLEANPHYHGGPPKTPRLELRLVRDASARIIMLVGGSADLAQNAVRPDLIDDVARSWRVDAESGRSNILSYLMMNNDDPVFRDRRVRQAFALALDREPIIAARFGGRAVLATGLLAPDHWCYEPEVTTWKHDPERAMQLLDEAGYPAPPGGGPRLRVVYKTSADQFRVAVARVIAAQLGEIGVEVEVRSFEFNTFFSDVKKGDYQMASMQTTDIGEPDFYRTYFSSKRIPDPAHPNWQNRWHYRNARVDDLTEQGRRAVDLELRRFLYAELQRIVARDVPIIPLWHEDNVVLHNVDVSGFRILPNARYNGLASAAKATLRP